MKIKSLKISNILSFEEKDDIEQAQEIILDDDLNILIGENASGKSNFIEILNRIFKGILILNCNMNETVFINNEKDPTGNPLNQVLTKKNTTHDLPKNFNCKTPKQQIKIKLKLEDEDYQNLEFIINNLQDINLFLKTYSRIGISFDEGVAIEHLKTKSEIEFHFIDDDDKKLFSLNKNFEDAPNNFIFKYFQLYHFIQQIIFVANRKHGTNWSQLKNILTLISSYRNYDKISDMSTVNPNEFDTLQQIMNKFEEESARKAGEREPVIFEMVKHRFSFNMNQIEHAMTLGKIEYDKNKSALDFLRESDVVFQNIEKLLKTHLKLRLKIDNVERTTDYSFSLMDENNEKVEVFDLSSGHKGILHFIFSLYGYDMKNGMMFIDEPELHLHPQIQRKYLDIIEEVKDKINTQFIMATHSPIFVSLKTIESIHRFYKENNFTYVVKPIIDESERELIHILTFTNTSKIFFSSKVILVEGDKDDYFFRYYLNRFANRMKIDSSNIEILNIEGKGNFRMWNKFLSKFKIQSYYIGDFDNLVEDYVTDNAKNWKSKFGNKLLHSEIEQIQKNHNQDYKDMMNEIQKLSTQKIFLLKYGSLEDYVQIISGKTPKFEDLIKFCKNDFDSWILKNPSDNLVLELDNIMNNITT